jgi:hypothetical protein
MLLMVPRIEIGRLKTTYLVPLADMMLLTLQEESLVVWNAVLAVDEAATRVLSVLGSPGTKAQWLTAEPLETQFVHLKCKLSYACR